MMNVEITLDDFNNFRWQKPLKDAEHRECLHYFISYKKYLERAKSERSKRVYSFLSAICSMVPHPDNIDSPFGPWSSLGGRRTAIPDDLDQNELELIKKLIPRIKDAALLARFSDILWIRCSDHIMARKAVGAYVESALRLDSNDQHSPCDQHLERAYRISMLLRDEDLNKYVVSHISQLVEKHHLKEPTSISFDLLDLLLEARTESSEKYASFAEDAASACENIHNYRSAREYWSRADMLFRIAKKSHEVKRCRLQVAKSYEDEVANRIASSSKADIYAQDLLCKAIEAYSRLGGNKDKVEELNRRLCEIQRSSAIDLHLVSTKIDITIDITEVTVSSQNLVAGKDLREAIRLLAFYYYPCIQQKITELAKETIKAYPFQSLAQRFALDEKGKIVYRRDVDAEKDVFDEIVLKETKIQHMQIHRKFAIEAYIDPMRLKILSEHYIRKQDFYPFVTNNPFIPEDREEIFALGLYHGMRGDLFLSSSLLIPQFENSLRYLLQLRGKITTKLTPELIQQDYMLGPILNNFKDDLIDILGEDYYYDFMWLLNDNMDSNIRNVHCHGISNYSDYYEYPYLYFWWLMLRICLTPSYKYWKEKDKQ